MTLLTPPLYCTFVHTYKPQKSPPKQNTFKCKSYAHVCTKILQSTKFSSFGDY